MTSDLMEIKGFPGYLYNRETSEFVSMRQKRNGLVLKVSERSGVQMVTMFQDGIPRGISVNRMIYAIRNGIGYDEIPKDVFVIRNGDGYELRNASDMAEYTHEAFRNEKKDRIEYINEKIRRLETMKQVYASGDIKPAVEYIERWKWWLIRKIMKQNNCKKERGELIFSWAYDVFCERLKDGNCQITDMILYFYGLMRKLSKRER